MDAGRNGNCSLQQDNILCVISVLVRTAKPNAFETWGIILVENVREKCVVPCFWLLGCCNCHPAVFCVGYLTAQCIMHKARRSAQNYETPILSHFPASHSLDLDNKLRIQGSSICMQMSSHPLNSSPPPTNSLSSSLDLPVRPTGEHELLNCQTTWLIGRIVWRPVQFRTAVDSAKRPADSTYWTRWAQKKTCISAQ